MTKADLIDLVAERTKLPHGRAELLVCQMFDSMVDALSRGEGIEIRGFGSFSIRAYKEYQGRNPRTGDAVYVRPKRLAFFKVGKELRERVNNGRGGKATKQTTPPTGSAPPISNAGSGSEPLSSI
jgi:integration host factor subunit beta